MKFFKNKKIQSIILLDLILLVIESVFRIISGFTLFNFSFLRIFFECTIISIIFGYINALFKPSINYILNCIVALICTVYAWIELGFYNFLGVYISFNTSSQLGAVKDYIFDFMKSLKPLYYLLFIPLIIFCIGYYLIYKYEKKAGKLFTLKEKSKNQNMIISISSVLMIFVFSILFEIFLSDNFMDDRYQVISNKDLFITAENPSLCVKEFGIMPFGIIDIKAKLSGVEPSGVTYLAYLGKEEKDLSRKIDDTAWKSIIESETNSLYINLNDYFINGEITDKNEQTGLFKDKNLIVVMMESVNDVIYNEEYYPNFYKLATEGWYFENNYSPRNSCATGNNEFSAMTGLYSIYNSCTSNTYQNNTYFTSIFNLFNRAGYTTNSFHNYTNAYYYRTIIHPNMGSGKYYDVYDLDLEFDPNYGGWSDDNDLMEKYLETIDSIDGNFMSYITTVSSHQPYNSSKFGDMYYDMTEGTDYSSSLRHYMSKLKVLDEALGVLVDGLEERNLLNDTVIVLFGDHYPYGLTLDTLNEILKRDLNDYENEKVPLVIYNPEINAKKFDTYTSYLNLTPTIANLFDLEFDPRLYSGVDIFSEDYNNMVVFYDSSWKNDIAYYNASLGTINYFTDKTYTDEEIKNINGEIYNKMNSSQLAIKNNYFAHLEKAFNKYEEEHQVVDEEYQAVEEEREN